MEIVYVFDENQEGVYKRFTINFSGNNSVTSVTNLGLAGTKEDNILVKKAHDILSGKKIIWITSDKKHKENFVAKGDKVIYFASNNSTTKEKIDLLNQVLNKNNLKDNTGLLDIYGEYTYIRIERERIVKS